MQYILTEEEYNALRKKQTYELNDSRGELQILCTKIANEMPWDTWRKGAKPRPWGCILTSDDHWYCDSCPVKKICPNQNKEWSK